jgi:hypothetical protein
MKPAFTVRDALLLVLDQVDYMRGACAITEMVGAALPVEVIEIARAALEQPLVSIGNILEQMEKPKQGDER